MSIDNAESNNKRTSSSNGSQEFTNFPENKKAKIITASIPENSQKWQDTLNKVIKSVVSVQFSQVAAFGTDPPFSSEASGFVVDAKRGIILTNHHVVGDGPFVGYVIFDNHEEVEVKPIYRDPVHDFGFLKFDPNKVKYMEITELKLRPDLAKVGCEIRVVGNDNGEKLSILSGFISRLDRNAPDYGPMTYNDFNTEYIQAAASASGGSSGSPVIDIDGHTVALQAGGLTKAATDFFLPVYRVKRALELLQANKSITRGTIQVGWYLKPFDECRRLGLTDSSEGKFRRMFPKISSLLVADTILPEGPLYQKVKEGDILLSINGKAISTFITVDDILDDSIGQEINIEVERSGEILNLKCKVQDLHAITPKKYFKFSGASFNDITYPLAKWYVVPMKGVFLNSRTGTFRLGSPTLGWVINKINNVPTPNLEKFIEVVKDLRDRDHVTVEYYHISNIQAKKIDSIFIDRHWYSSSLRTRNDESGLWDLTKFEDSPDTKASDDKTALSAKFIDLPNEKPEIAKLVRSFVYVSVRMTHVIDSYPFSRKHGPGIVIDAEKGYVLVSRMIVPHELCEILVNIAESVYIRGKVIFLHPTHNYAIIQYDTSKLMDANVVESLKFKYDGVQRGQSFHFVGYKNNNRVLSTEVKISDMTTGNIPYDYNTPRYRALNMEAILCDNNAIADCPAGVFCDANTGETRAIWLEYLGETNSDNTDSTYRVGIDARMIKDVVENIRKNNGVIKRTKLIDAEFIAISVVGARMKGISENWITEMQKVETDKYKFLTVDKVTFPENKLTEVEKMSKKKSGNSDCKANEEEEEETGLKTGDVLLTLNGRFVNLFYQLEGFDENVNEVDLLILRDRKEILLKVAPQMIKDVDHLISWCGVDIQAPSHPIRQGAKQLPSRVYINNYQKGSPAEHYGIGPTNLITHVNDVITPDLQLFMEEVKKIKDNTYCKLRVITLEGAPFAISLKTNYHYFPTSEMIKKNGKWELILYDKYYEVSDRSFIEL